MLTQMRSVIGAPGVDPRELLRGLAALKRLTEQLEESVVAQALSIGMSWSEIAEELDVSKQVAHRKYKGKLFTSGRR